MRAPRPASAGRAPAVFLAAVLALGSCSGSRPHSESQSWLGTLCTITVYGKPRGQAMAEAFAKIAEIDARMGSERPESEIDAVAAAAGVRPVAVTEDVFAVLRTGLEYARLTEGAFDPTIGPLVRLWDISTGPGRVPSREEIERTRPLVDYRKVILDPQGSTVYLREPGMALDLGGIAKGYAADQVAAILRAAGVGSAIVDLGGNILAMGPRPGGGRWRIGVQDPEKPRGEYFGIVELSEGSVVTSGVYERYFIQGGVRYHHILDPATGAPARTGLLSVTVVAARSMDADALSTALFVLGAEKGLSLLDRLQEVEAIFVTEDHRVIVSPGLAGRFRLTSPAYRIEGS